MIRELSFIGFWPLNDLLNGSINSQFVENWFISIAAASVHDKDMTVFDNLCVRAAINKLRFFFPQNSVQIDVQSVLFEHSAVYFVVNFDFPGFEDF